MGDPLQKCYLPGRDFCLTVSSPRRKVPITMKTPLRLGYVLFVLVFCFSCAKTAPMATNESGYQLTIELRDGSCVIGKTPNDNLGFHSTTLGDLKLSWAAIRAIDYTANADTARLTATNGDGINVKPAAGTVRVETSYGKSKIPMKLIQSIKVSAVAKPGQLPEGLVAYYPLNGNANDASGNNYNGRIVGATPCQDRFGKANSAFSFNGVDNYISFESVPLKQIDNCSLSAWINPVSIDQNSMAVCMGYDDGSVGNGFEFGVSGGNSPGNHLYGILGTVAWIDSGYVFPSPNVWYHVVMLRTDGVTKFYVNGIQTVNTESRSPLTPSAFTIGSATGIRFFNGMIDDVRIYNRALSAAEIQAIYTEQR